MNKEERKEYNRKYREEHREESREAAKKWRSSHLEYFRNYMRKRNGFTGEKRTRMSDEELRVAQKGYQKKYYDTHKKQRSLAMKLWQALNSGKLNENNKKWLKKNPDKRSSYVQNRRARESGNGGSFTAQEWQSLKEKYNYTCLCCGKREPEIKLTPDHVLPLALGGSSNIGNIQPLCKPCNCRKQAKHIDYRGKK